MNVSIQEILTQAVGFILLVIVLKRLLWVPVLTALEKRRQGIQEDFDTIEKDKQDIAKLKEEYNAHLQKMDEEARAKLQETVEEGRRIAREIQEKARAEAQAAFEKSKENLNMEIVKARVELRAEIADLTVSAAERVLGEKMTDKDRQNVKILEIIEELEKTL